MCNLDSLHSSNALAVVQTQPITEIEVVLACKNKNFGKQFPSLHYISSSSVSSEILIFSIADLMRLESELLGFRSKAVL